MEHIFLVVVTTYYIRLVTRFPCLYLFVITYFLPSTYYNTMHEHGTILLIALKIHILEKNNVNKQNQYLILSLTMKYTFKQMVTLPGYHMKKWYYHVTFLLGLKQCASMSHGRGVCFLSLSVQCVGLVHFFMVCLLIFYAE